MFQCGFIMIQDGYVFFLFKESILFFINLLYRMCFIFPIQCFVWGAISFIYYSSFLLVCFSY